MKVAEKMKKKYAGNQPYSPKYRKYSDTIELWKRMVKLRKNVNTSRAILRRLAKRIEVPWSFVSLTNLEECKENLRIAYKEYYKKRSEFEGWRNEYNQSLINALAEEQNKQKEQI